MTDTRCEMLLELILIGTAYLALALLEPNDRQRERARRGLSGQPFREQLAVLQRVGVVRSR